jgi:hypothetical protein
VIPTITDTSFSRGRIGFWTKSDSVSYFTDSKIVFKPREIPAQALVRRTGEKYSRLLGLKIFVSDKDGGTKLVASKDAAEIGASGGKAEAAVISEGQTYYGKGKTSVSVTMPLRDQNGDIVAAAKLVMKTFPGQTEKNAVERAAPIVREMQAQLHSLQELLE